VEFFERLKQRPWNSHYYATKAVIPPWFANFPTMMSLEEMRMLAWIAQFNPKGGTLIDLGPFLGGSTVAMAHGLMAARKTDKIHSFDFFEISEPHKHHFYYKRGYEYFEGSDTVPVFNYLTNYFSELIIGHKGDVLKEKCPSNDPSVVFIDLSKTWQLNDHLLVEFFTNMKAGCVIVQQDFIYFQYPWLCHTMKMLENKVEFLSNTEDHSVVYGVHAPITRKDILPCLRANVTNEQVAAAIIDSKKHFSGLRQLEMIDALLASFNARPDALNAWDYPNTAIISSELLPGNKV
jgi:hypothetical protein